jgi:hypothetical protein
MVVPVALGEHLDRHAEEAGGLPCVGALLHEPRRGGVAQRVRGHVGAKASLLYGGREPLADRFDRLALPLHAEPLPAPFPAPQMAEQLGG